MRAKGTLASTPLGANEEIYLALYDDLFLVVSTGLVTFIKAKLNKKGKMTYLGLVDMLPMSHRVMTTYSRAVGQE